MSNKKTFWPYGILISILLIVLSCIITVIYSSNYPVYEDDFYFEKYQNIKDNYAQIEKKEQAFNENFNLYIKDDNYKKVIVNVKTQRLAYVLNYDDTDIKLFLEKIKNNDFAINNIIVKLTRPHTNAQDKDLVANVKKINDKLSQIDISMPKLSKGRWQIKVKIDNENLATFKNFDLLVE